MLTPATVRSVLAQGMTLDDTLAALGLERRTEPGRSVSGRVHVIGGETFASAAAVWQWLRRQGDGS